MAKHWKRDKVMPGLSIYYTLYLLFYMVLGCSWGS